MRSRLRADDERGSAAAEFAVALPAVLLVLAACLSAVQVAGQHVRLQDAAAGAARSVARGESSAEVAARASRLVPGASLSSWVDGDLECVTASAQASGLVGVAGMHLEASSCALGGGG